MSKLISTTDLIETRLFEGSVPRLPFEQETYCSKNIFCCTFVDYLLTLVCLQYVFHVIQYDFIWPPQ